MLPLPTQTDVTVSVCRLGAARALRQQISCPDLCLSRHVGEPRLKFLQLYATADRAATLFANIAKSSQEG